MARNVTASFDKSGNLVIVVKADKATRANAPVSASGKSRVFATTEGNMTVATPDGGKISLGINAYEKV